MTESTVEAPTLKILLLGDERVGKTSLGKWCQSGEFEIEYSVTSEAGVYHYRFDTNRGPINFALWDIPGQAGYASVKDEYTKGIHGAIIMFDLQNPATYDSVSSWYNTIPKKLPIVLCGNKVDLPYRKLGPRTICFHRENGLQYFDFSVKANLSRRRPFIWLARKILEDPQLEDIESPSLGIYLPQVEYREQIPQYSMGRVQDDRPENFSGHNNEQHAINLLDDYGGKGAITRLRATIDQDPAKASSLQAKPQESLDATLQNLYHRLQGMIERLRQNPNFKVIKAEVTCPTSQSEIDEARQRANGYLPIGVEDFYRQVGSFNLEWEYELTKGGRDDARDTGHINILPIGEIFGDNWRGITWFPLPNDVGRVGVEDEWRYIFRNVVPFDFFIPEACMCFTQEHDGTPEDYVGFHSFGRELCRTRYTFPEYIAFLLTSHGYYYWMETLCPGHEDSMQVESFRLQMPEIFPHYDDSLFRP